jgi:tetratricopeptide (TPR) repeat protein
MPVVEAPAAEDFLAAEVPSVEEAELPIPGVPPVEEVAPLVIEERVEEAIPVEEVAPPVIEERVEEAIPAEEAALPAFEEPVVEPLVSAAPVEEPPVEEVVEEPSRVEELEAELKARPRDHGVRLELARLYRDDQDWNASLAQYEKLVSARKYLPEVREELESMVEEDVNRAQLYQLLGDIHMQQDDLDGALEMYRLARQSLS